MKQLNEGLDYHDFEGQLHDVVTIDEYSAKIGKDSDIVTLTFTVNSKAAAEDLVSWLEIGYDYILDASVSDGEIEPGKYLVFAEMNRRTSVPQRICELLSDLETLTAIPIEDWKIEIEKEQFPAKEEILKEKITLSPHEYRIKKENEGELNEMREIANISTKKLYDEDTYIKNLKAIAGF